MEVSQYERQDIMEEFDEDVRALNILERDYSSFSGYTEFMRLMSS